MARRVCVVCATPFQAPPSSKTITCSNECSRARKRATPRYTGHDWSPEARDRIARKGRTPNLELGTPAALLSPIAGPFETNQEAKLWRVVNLSTGARYEARNLRKWCRDNAGLFAPDPWPNAYAGLLQVQRWLQGKSLRKVSRWKEWTLAAPGVDPHKPLQWPQEHTKEKRT